ncbi:MAG: glycerol-3-phosphate dehydrogenase [NAD(P)+] [Polyangiaceae bacterium]
MLPPMAVVTVVGAGMMGTALCYPLCDAGHEVRLVGTHLDREIVECLKSRSHHPKLALDVPTEIRPYFLEELGAAMRGVEIIGVGVSSAGVHWAGEQLRPFVRPEIPVVMITKGLEWSGQELAVLPDVLESCLAPELRGKIHPAAVAGPCIAGELARRVETCVVVTGRDGDKLGRLERALRTPYYHPFTSRDVVGVEVCAALKNAYAMGIAFALGLHEKSGGVPGSIAQHNYEAAVFAQSVREMRLLVRAAGGDPESASGLAGVGDLDVTTNGGRTGRFGKLLGLGLSVAEAVERMQGATLECLDILRVMRAALPSLRALGAIGQNSVPLLEHLAEVALDGKPVAVPFARFFG